MNHDNQPTPARTLSMWDDAAASQEQAPVASDPAPRPDCTVDEAAVEAVIDALRTNLLNNSSDDKVRKAVALLPSDRRKVRRRNVDTDVPVSDLVFDAVLDMLKQHSDVPAATARAAKNRTDRLTLTAPAWWWSLVDLTAQARNGHASDVISTAINKHLA